MRHAYLILAHGDFPLLKRLVEALDDPGHDIYVHVDLKAGGLPELSTRQAGLQVFSEVDVRWGDLSVIEAEYALFGRALAKGGYGYYHLLSGSDLPVRPVAEIKAFFEAHAGTDFMDVYPCEETEFVRNFRYWHLFPRQFRNATSVEGLAMRCVRAVFLRLQMLLHIRRNRRVEFRKGSQWMSVTEPLVRYAMSQRGWVESTFTHTFCPDEVFMQTLCARSPMADRDIHPDGWGNGHKRYIDWSGGHVHTLGAADLEAVRASGALFARKFTSDDAETVEKVLAWQRK